MKNTFRKSIRQTMSIFLAIFLLLGTIPIVGVSAAEVTSNFEYTLLDDGTIEVTRYVGTDSYVIIPEEIDGKPVTKVNEFCFFNDDDYIGLNYTVKSIFISKNITDFSNTDNNEECRCLNRILYLESISVDKDNLVYSSDSGILFSKDFTSLIYYPRCKTGEEYIVPEYVKEIGNSAFSESKNLHSLKFSSFFEKMGVAAVFNGNIEEAEYPVYPKPSSKISLFTWCEKLSKVYISKDVKWMNEYDFMQSPNVTLYVYNNSYALDWAKEHGFSYVIMDEPPIEKALVDESTGIKVNGTMDPDATLKVEKIENTAENAAATYDITLCKDKEAVQPTDTLTISIPSENSGCKVVWLKDDGAMVDMKASYQNGSYVFTTDHLGKYALVKQRIYGDINGDGAVTVNDATEIQKASIGLVELSNDQLKCADVNGNGIISITDVTLIQKYIAGDYSYIGSIGQEVSLD
ncbi:MAG: dockerin type I repeat-containing protein [Clostridia bacterium]|nr:dockerin type I repeat-containing protein [Clostridia bacterium]